MGKIKRWTILEVQPKSLLQGKAFPLNSSSELPVTLIGISARKNKQLSWGLFDKDSTYNSSIRERRHLFKETKSSGRIFQWFRLSWHIHKCGKVQRESHWTMVDQWEAAPSPVLWVIPSLFSRSDGREKKLHSLCVTIFLTTVTSWK